MILSFKPQFKEPILNGSKIHTIREDATDRWKEGNSIQCATGVRTKNYNCFKRAECVSTQRIFMTYAYDDILDITIGDRYIHDWKEKERLALNDGFPSWWEFFEWFADAIEANPKKQFSGKIIHWTDLRYEKEVPNG